MMEVVRHDRLLRNIPGYHDVGERAQAGGIAFKY
jgi:hypothetical protein